MRGANGLPSDLTLVCVGLMNGRCVKVALGTEESRWARDGRGRYFADAAARASYFSAGVLVVVLLLRGIAGLSLIMRASM